MFGVRSDIPTDNSPNKQLGEKKCNLSVSVGAEVESKLGINAEN